MDINFICTKKRKEFGKPCTFANIGPTLILEIEPNPDFRENFYMLSTVDREIDNTTRMCAHEVNTLTFPTENRGMNHMEGGWPSAVDNADKDSMARFRKKIEKDKSYVNAVKSLADLLENCIMENNSIDIYEEYFQGERFERDTDWSVKCLSMFQDIDANYRSVVDISWERDSTKFAAVYALEKINKSPFMPCIDSYVWDVENNVKPVYVMKPEVLMTVVEFSPMDNNLILSGYISGQVALWDIRAREQAQQLSSVAHSHSQKVTGIKWLWSKQGTGFFSASSDGKLICWDARNISSPIETVHLDTIKSDASSNLKEDYSISCIGYDISVPDKFMVGTDQGVILNFNRNFKSEEDKLDSLYDCDRGPLLTLERNAFYPQLFASCDAWSIKLWSDGVTDTPVLDIVSQDGYFSDFAWSPTRASTMYVTKTTGILEIWDIPGKSKDALLTVKLEDESLFCVGVPQSGNQLICGSLSGSIHLLSIPDYLRKTSDLEKNLIKGCIRETEEIIGGDQRSVRIRDQEMQSFSDKILDDEWWDPPEKAEDLYEEYKELFKNFVADESAN